MEFLMNASRCSATNCIRNRGSRGLSHTPADAVGSAAIVSPLESMLWGAKALVEASPVLAMLPPNMLLAEKGIGLHGTAVVPLSSIPSRGCGGWPWALGSGRDVGRLEVCGPGQPGTKGVEKGLGGEVGVAS